MRMKRREIPGGFRFVTFSCERRLPLLGHPAIRELFAWVAMPEHVHLIVRPNDRNPLDRVLEFLKKAVARRVIARWRELGAPILKKIERPDGSRRFWQKGGGFDRNIRDQAELARAIVYIHRNPVERGLVERPQDWKWSSASWWLGLTGCLVHCDPVTQIEVHRRALYM